MVRLTSSKERLQPVNEFTSTASRPGELTQESIARYHCRVPLAHGPERSARLGQYEVRSLLGVGGMGEVYRARDTRLGRDVAIKILPSAFTSDRSRLERFEREARVLASLNHPNIAAIYGVEEHGDVRGLVLELVDGDTLADRLAKARAPLSVTEAVAIAKQIVEALDASHEKGICHRDLKPANITITPAGLVKVLDFGLATRAADPSRPDGATMTWTGTQEGLVVGTAAYMSPEQARGLPVDKRTDIWAFGCVLYEMLTGRAAFKGETVSDTLAAVLQREPAWEALPSTVPSAVARLLRRSLEKDPKRRLRDIGDALAELDETASARKQIEPGGTASHGRSKMVAGAIVAGLAVVALAAAAVWMRPAATLGPLPETRLEIATPLSVGPEWVALSPDGRTVAFVAESQGTQMLWLRALSSVSAQPLEGTDGASHPFWSPDGRAIGFFANGKLKQIDIGGGGARVLADAANPQGGSWGPDDTIVFTPHQLSPLVRLRLGEGGTSEITRLATSQLGHLFPQLLPDGVHVLYFATGETAVRGVYVARLDGTASQRVLGVDLPAVFVSGGHLLFIRDKVLLAQAFDVATLAVRGSPRRVADSAASDGFGWPAASASMVGSVVYRTVSPDEGNQLTWFDRSGRVLARVGPVDTARTALDLVIALSPDGRRVALPRMVDGNRDIWLLDLERSGVMSRVTFDPAVDGWPLWSPDGQRVVFGTTRHGRLDAYERRIGGDADEPLVVSPQNKVPAAWSRDGRVLLYVLADPKRHLDIWAWPVGNREPPFPVVTTEYEDLNPQFSPDGQWVAYQSDQSRRYEVYLQRFRDRGEHLPISIEGGTQPRWRDDGRELFYLGLDRRLMAVPIAFSPDGQSVRVGDPVPLFQTAIGGDAGAQRQYEVSADGQRFLIDVPQRQPSPLVLIQNWKP